MRHTTAEQPGKSRVVLALVMAGGFLLAGCTSPPDAGPTTPPASAPATTEPVVTTAPPPTTPAVYMPATDQGPAQNVPVPVLPEKAKEFSKEGLIAFTEYWYSTLGYAFETGDPAPMMAITGPSCPSCEAMKVAVIPWHANGRWIVGGQMVVLDTSTTFSPANDGTYQVTALVRQTRLKFYRGDKTLADDRGQKPSVGDVFVAEHDAGHWRAMDVRRLEGM